MAEVDLLFAFDVRIDRPPCPVDMPSAGRRQFATAAIAALRGVFEEATGRKARAVVLFGDLLDPARTSPAQAADIAEQIDAFVEGGGAVVVTTAGGDAANALATALGEPPGLSLLTPGTPVLLRSGRMIVELACDDPSDVQITTLREAATDTLDEADVAPQHVVRALVRGRRDRPRAPLADTAAYASLWTLPSLQPRSRYEHGPGSAGCLRLSSEGRINGWSEFSTALVSWHDVRTVCSASEQEEELSATAAVEMEQAVAACQTPLAIMRLLVDCEADAERRGRVSRMAPAVLGEMRQLLETMPDAPDQTVAWCEQVEADPAESLASIADADDIGGSRRFPAMLAAEAATWPLTASGDDRVDPAEVVREATWMTLELLEHD